MLSPAKTEAIIDENNIKIDVINRGHFVLNGKSTYILELKITNKSKADISFWNWSCSITEGLVFRSKKYDLLPSNCNNNSPILICLKPEESLCSNFLIITKNEASDDFTFNLGFIFIPESDYVMQPGISFVNIIEKAKLQDKQVIYYGCFSLLSNREQVTYKLSP